MRSFLSVVLPIAFLTTLCTVGCETSQPRKSSLLPPKATAPEVSAPVEQKADPPAPKVQPPAAPKPDAAAALIAQAEKQYASGRENYQAGHLEAAKKEFDQAFNTLLSSNLDIHGDRAAGARIRQDRGGRPRTGGAALQKGDGFTEQQSEPAPIDEANDITFPVDPNITRQGRSRDQDHQVRPAAGDERPGGDVHQLLLQPPRQGHAGARLGALGTLPRMIAETLKQEGVPQDLIYLAQAESGFQPLALSRAGARGMWQFMAQSGGSVRPGAQLVGRRPAGPGEVHQAAARH